MPADFAHATAMNNVLTEYYRCPDNAVDFGVVEGIGGDAGFFRFGADTVCYGQTGKGTRARSPRDPLYDVLNDIDLTTSRVDLPFDPTQVVRNLRFERYANGLNGGNGLFRSSTRNIYYWIRPLMGVSIRKQFQKLRLNGWRDLPYPRWPVDTTVEALLGRLLLLSLKSTRSEAVPFIWFWPDGREASAIVTHDVETMKGVSFCSRLMDINQSFGIPASFQLVPEDRYQVSEHFLDSIRSRGFEINVQDLNHDGHLFRDLETFKRRVGRINQYGVQYGAIGFRSAVLYRNQEWYDWLDFEYDMSVPNVAHLDPQRGGCCTVMPYFVGKILELPVTTMQDYSLFHILNNYSLDLWKIQIEAILAQHGLISFIVHPDYIRKGSPLETYKSLLQILEELRKNRNVWIPLPREANRWWRQRSQMQLVMRDGQWLVDGPGSERARVAFASCEDGQLVYRVCDRQLQPQI